MYQNDYTITADGFGIHTFELTGNITSYEFRHIPYRAGNKKFYFNGGKSVCVYPKKQGIRIFLNNPEEDVYSIKIIVTPRKIIDEDSDAVSILPPANDLIRFGNRVTDILQECLGEKYHIEYFTLSRVDFCVNIMLSESFAAQRYIKLLHKSMKYNSTDQIVIYSNDDPDAKEKNKHSFRINTGDVTFTAYDKYFQLEDIGESFEKEAESFLRLELSINRDKILELVCSRHEWLYNTNLLEYYSCHSRKYFVDYIEKYFFPGDYCYLEYMEHIIEKSRLKNKMKGRMLLFSAIQCEKQSFLSAKKEMMKYLDSTYKFKKMLSAFEDLNINPISLSYRDKHGANVIPGLYKILGL
ncbi:MAG: hypothetical protein ACI4J6_04970 [Oscillospiraceae bacterium]